MLPLTYSKCRCDATQTAASIVVPASILSLPVTATAAGQLVGQSAALVAKDGAMVVDMTIPPGVVAGTMTTAVIVAALEAALAAMPAVASRRELAASGRALAIAADADRCGRLAASAGRKNGPQGQFQLRGVSTVSCNHSTTVCTGYAVSGRGRD